MTRMGIAALIRNALSTARDYLEKKEAAGDDKSKLPPYDAKSEAIIPALKKEIPLKIHCEQFDMITAIDIAKEFGCAYSIEHAWAADDYYDELVEGDGDRYVWAYRSPRMGMANLQEPIYIALTSLINEGSM